MKRRHRNRCIPRQVVRWLEQRDKIVIDDEITARLPSLIAIRRCRFLLLMTMFPMTRPRCHSPNLWMTQAEIRAPADCSVLSGASVSMLEHSMLDASFEEVDLSPMVPSDLVG